MARKHIILFTILALCSIASGAVLGLLDIFGFVDGRHTLSFILLTLSAVLLYITLITVFLIELSDSKRAYSFFGVSTVLFGVTFFLMNLQPVLSLLAGIAYALLLTYTHSESTTRAKLFRSFMPSEIFFPILKKSFTYFLIIISILTFAQSQRLVSENALIQPGMIRFIMKPSVIMINQQINSQLSPVMHSNVFTSAPPALKKQALSQVLRKSVESMKDPQSGTVYGFKPKEIPIEKASISDVGTVDIGPVIEAMLPGIAFKLNQIVQKYAVFAPFAVALLAYFILQPIIIPLQLIETGLTLLIFKVLKQAKILKIKEEQQIVEVPYI